MFVHAIAHALNNLKHHGRRVHPDRWQAIDVSARPEAAAIEVLGHTMKAMFDSEDINDLRHRCEPNLPWADAHFDERVSGVPLNPGETWKTWPWGHSADKFRDTTMASNEKHHGMETRGFSHTYMERMWPRKANLDTDMARNLGPHGGRTGIRFKYGDALDVATHLARHPLSRQAFVPIWFPEDTGKEDVRVPCTIGYHFIMRDGFFHCTYYIRSCDAYRHLRDDVYLTARLQLWMLDRIREANGQGGWAGVKPGMLTMHIVSLHVFVNDYVQLFKQEPPP